MIAIGDVHGEYKTLLKLLEILPQTKDICFVGDLIDRGPSSKYVIKLIRENDWLCVLGNHEDMATGYGMTDIWVYNGGMQTLKSYDCNFDYSSFEKESDFLWMQNLPLIIETNTHIISHSFCYKGNETPANDILWGRSFEKNSCEKINIFGHTPLKEVKKIHNKHWNIDTGCTYCGKLSAIDLDTNIIYSVDKVK